MPYAGDTVPSFMVIPQILQKRALDVSDVSPKSFSLLSILLALVDLITSRRVALAADAQHCLAGQDTIVGQVSSLSPACGTIRG